MNLGLLLFIVLLIMLFGGLPAWGLHSYGYGPSGGVAVVLIILVVLMPAGRI